MKSKPSTFSVLTGCLRFTNLNGEIRFMTKRDYLADSEGYAKVKNDLLYYEKCSSK